MLFWNGTLITLPIGFCASLASSSTDGAACAVAASVNHANMAAGSRPKLTVAESDMQGLPVPGSGAALASGKCGPGKGSRPQVPGMPPEEGGGCQLPGRDGGRRETCAIKPHAGPDPVRRGPVLCDRRTSLLAALREVKSGRPARASPLCLSAWHLGAVQRSSANSCRASAGVRSRRAPSCSSVTGTVDARPAAGGCTRFRHAASSLRTMRRWSSPQSPEGRRRASRSTGGDAASLAALSANIGRGDARPQSPFLVTTARIGASLTQSWNTSGRL